MSHGALFIKTRARKKKTLTEPIDLIPFPEKSLRNLKNPPKEKDSPSPEVKNKVSKETSEKPAQKKPKPNLPKTGHLSIKQILQDELENQV